MAASFEELTRRRPEEGFFELANRKVVRCTFGAATIEVEQDTKLHDSCGGIVWETAYCLGKYAHRELAAATGAPPRTLRCLEVGAGCGLVGLSLAALGCSVVCTDTGPALPLLRRNVDRNRGVVGGKVDVVGLDWTDDEQLRILARRGPYDVIVGTDVVFAQRLVQPLLRVLHTLSGANTLIWICVQERCSAAFGEFVEALPQWFQVRRVPSEKLQFPDHACILFQMSKKADAGRPRASLMAASSGVVGESKAGVVPRAHGVPRFRARVKSRVFHGCGSFRSLRSVRRFARQRAMLRKFFVRLGKRWK
mmetsp:Transcript_102596/g.235385  ORF Transcript_102596/g.235385 Transcript_102596/m.235385 type:complete len:308 (+) Transcript_102596:25-948(+)